MVWESMELSSRERVEMAFNFEEPDRVPIFEQGIAPNVASEILDRYAYTGCGGMGAKDTFELLIQGKRDYLVEHMCRDLVELHVKLDLDIVRPPLAPRSDAKGPNKVLEKHVYYFEDEESGMWYVYKYSPKSKMMTLVDSSIKREGLRGIKRLVEHLEESEVEYDESVFEVMDYVIDELGDQKFIAGHGGIGVPMDTPWIVALIKRPDLVERYLDQQLRRTMELIKLEKNRGVDFILGGGDLATTKGPMYSPRLFRRLLLPRLKKLVNFCHELGLPYIFRTDGNVWPIAKELFIESGVDGYGEIDAQAGMDLGELKKEFPNLILWGNVDCAYTLVFGPEEKVVRETIDCIRKAARGGGYILGSSNTIHPNVKTRYFLLMLQIAKEYGKYPMKI